MRGSIWIRMCIGVAALAWVFPFFVFPSQNAGAYLSPDETAVVVASTEFLRHGSMRISDTLVSEFPWLHPRSFVSVPGAIVPVGFLGMPIVFGLFRALFGDLALAVLPLLLAISVVFPLVHFTHRWKPASRIIVLSVWLSFPTVIFYANRGTFPNLNALCLTIWGLYLLWSKRTTLRSFLAGVLLGFALVIRPIEAFWILPWLLLAWRFREHAQRNQERVQLLSIGIGIYLVALLYLVIAYRTYGNPFAIGYWMHDAILNPASGSVESVAASPFWPFGIHPMHVLFNVKNYLGWFLGPWTVLTALSAIAYWRHRISRPFIAVALWTVISLVLVYGQAVYQDHVGLNVASSGNSFLRYLLPFSVIAALSIGALSEWLSTRIDHRHWKTLTALTAAVLYLLGTWSALQRDDEGLLKTRRDLAEYARIRDEAATVLSPDTVVLSDRSDKIFFPVFSSASPIPPIDEIARLSYVRPVAVYTREVDTEKAIEFGSAGLSVEQVYEGMRESLYVVHAVTNDE